MVKTRKLSMQFQESKEKRYVTFTKRRKGLFNKAAELCMLCDAQVAILVTSPCSKHKVFSFAPTSIDAILESFLGKHVPENMDNGTKHVALSLFSRNIRNKNKGAQVSSASETCPWMNIVEFEESIEGIHALIDGLEKLKAKAEKKLENSSFYKFPTTTNFATSKDTHDHINPYYDHGYFNGQDNIDSSHYNGTNFPLGGDMNGFGNETNMVSCEKDSWNLPKSEYSSYYNGLHNGNEDTIISSDSRFLNSSFENEFLGQPFF